MWQYSHLRLYALFWAENPVILEIYEEFKSTRKRVLMDRLGIKKLLATLVTIVQFCDQKIRNYNFIHARVHPRGAWRLQHGHLREFNPEFEVVYRHKGCLQAGDCITTVVRGASVVNSIHYRRCDGEYRNARRQKLIRNTEPVPSAAKTQVDVARSQTTPFGLKLESLALDSETTRGQGEEDCSPVATGQTAAASQSEF